VRKRDGTVVSFTEMSTLQQWILDGRVVGDDAYSADGGAWQKLKDAPQFVKLLEAAIASRKQARGSVKRPATQPPPPSSSPPTMSLDLPAGDPQMGAFQLGELPMAQTGAWGAQDMTLADARGASSVRVDEKDARIYGATMELLTPTTRPSPRSAGDGREARARVPAAVWMLGGIVVALALVGGGLAVVAPTVLASFFRQPLMHTEVIKAVAATRDDDPGTIDALLKDAETLADSAGVRARDGGDAAAAAALLHLARARIDDEVARIGALITLAGGVPPAAKGDAERHRVAAYRLATRAVAASQGSPGALLAMARYQGERSARAEFETDATQALAAAKGSAVEALVTSEIELIRSLVGGREALRAFAPSGGNVVALRAAAAKLAAIDDARARSASRLLRAHASFLADALARDDVHALRAELRSLGGGDARVAALTALTRLLDKKLGDSVKADAQKAPPSAGAVVDAGVPASALDAGTTLPVAAGTTAAATTEPATGGTEVAAPPVPTETYESALDKAEKAALANRSKEAARWAKKALEQKPGAVAAQIILGFAYIDLGGFDGASRVFKQVLAKQRKNCDAQIGLATVLDQQQKTEDARKEYMTYVDNCPTGKDIEAAKGAISRLE
jgi:tetratricopeptide (TPR) repeat protein